ncbi:flagellar hook assembly protein FlgD [Bacteriovorax sp. Seq25_V]|uniref:flagellar hook assembly protein FlgD n=1 Tax=Bacteriovorax sp. Seq25_V TaxID=1201288 RepID=UPI000389F13A|nr:flagellar hook assembly protein FlgD [Bacteriovorax sp. Seq25_V]EQC45516.1 flagellar hook capping protein N-terminal domain protein [Bacteriovorax sp. Seq25_V]
MPGIGRPQQQTNPFARISKAPAQAPGAKKVNTNGVGEALNEIAGVEEEKKFVDKETHNKMGKDGFLKLLAHQLQNQDPLKPMDQKQFSADLAQFSQLEQLTNMNAKFDKFGANAPQETKFYGASFLGKEIVTRGSSIHYNGQDRNVDIPFFLDQAATNVTVNIYDSKKQLIGKVGAESLSRGQNTLRWNGKQLDGVRATKDNYRIEVVAYDDQMNKFKAKTSSTGLVTGVNFDKGETILTLANGKEIFLRDVDSFKMPSNQAVESVPARQAAQAYQQNSSDNSFNQ